MPDCDTLEKFAELGMSPDVLERGLNAVSKPKDDEGVAEGEGALKYGHASLHSPSGWTGACTAPFMYVRVPDW